MKIVTFADASPIVTAASSKLGGPDCEGGFVGEPVPFRGNPGGTQVDLSIAVLVVKYTHGVAPGRQVAEQEPHGPFTSLLVCAREQFFGVRKLVSRQRSLDGHEQVTGIGPDTLDFDAEIGGGRGRCDETGQDRETGGCRGCDERTEHGVSSPNV